MKDDIQQKAMTSDLSFLDFFMGTLIDDARWTPKLQLERVIGPLLTPFIARLMTGALQNVDGLRGEYDLICAEFPLLKETDSNTQKKTYQSTNIDWLLLNTTNNKLLFLELKTNHDPFPEDQARIYSRFVNNNSSTISSILWNDYISICRQSRQRKKYQFQCGKMGSSLAASRTGSRVVYLSPQKEVDPLRRKVARDLPKPPDYVLCFKNLNFAIRGKYSSAWDIIRKHIVRLDSRDRPETQPCAGCIKPQMTLSAN